MKIHEVQKIIDRHGLTADSPWIDLVDAAEQALDLPEADGDRDVKVERLAAKIDRLLAGDGGV